MTWRDPEGSLGYFGQVFSVKESRFQSARYALDLQYVRLGSVIGVIQWEQPAQECRDRVHSVVVTTLMCAACQGTGFALALRPKTGIKLETCLEFGCRSGLVFDQRYVLHQGTSIHRRLSVCWLVSPETENNDRMTVGVYLTDQRGLMLQTKRK